MKKTVNPYSFVDDTITQSLQNYINDMNSTSHTIESFQSKMPPKLQQEFIIKFHITMQTNMALIWSSIIKDVLDAIILGSTKYAINTGNGYIIDLNAINKSLAELY